MKRTVRLLLPMLLAIAAAAYWPAVAQSVDAPPAKVYVIRTRVAMEHVAAWSRAVEKTVEAHARHDQGNTWAAYSNLTGGPEAEFVFLFPFEKFADLDGWKSVRRILVESLGDAVGREVAAGLELSTESTDRVITYVPALSHPADPVQPPAPAYFWEYNTRVRKGKLTEYAALMQRVIKAHAQSDRGLHWLAYGNALGGDREQVVFLVPFDRFAAVDEWPARGEILAELYGARDALRIQDALNTISETRHRIWRLNPALSRLPR